MHKEWKGRYKVRILFRLRSILAWEVEGWREQTGHYKGNLELGSISQHDEQSGIVKLKPFVRYSRMLIIAKHNGMFHVP